MSQESSIERRRINPGRGQPRRPDRPISRKAEIHRETREQPLGAASEGADEYNLTM